MLSMFPVKNWSFIGPFVLKAPHTCTLFEYLVFVLSYESSDLTHLFFPGEHKYTEASSVKITFFQLLSLFFLQNSYLLFWSCSLFLKTISGPFHLYHFCTKNLVIVFRLTSQSYLLLSLEASLFAVLKVERDSKD